MKRSAPTERKIAVADVETSALTPGEAPRTFFWGLQVEGEDYREFRTTRELWAFLRERPELLVYCHRDYDMIQALVDGEELRIGLVRHSRLLQAHGPGTVEWRDSHALYPSPLKEILESAGFKKPPLPERLREARTFEDLSPADRELLRERNRADTSDAIVAFRKIADAYERSFGIYPFGGEVLTAASCSFRASELVAGKLRADLRHREVYRGGRVEAFWVSPTGTESRDATYWDINSSYPYAFTDAPKEDYCYVLDVELKKTDRPTPFFELTETRRKLLFPSGKFRTAVFASNYERYIAPHGAVKSVKAVACYRVDLRWVQRVAELVRRAYAQRLEAKKRGDGATSYAIKIALNSIYGRLGMKAGRQVAIVKDRVAQDSVVDYYRLPGGKKLNFVTVFTRPRAHYLMAAWITCNARARLYDALARCSRPLYCDTDSILLEAGEKFPLRESPTRLGGWKHESEKDGPLIVHSAKDYELQGEVTRKGYKPCPTCRGTGKHDAAPCEECDGTGSAMLTWTLKGALDARRGTCERSVRTRKSAYDKREVRADGSTMALFRE